MDCLDLDGINREELKKSFDIAQPYRHLVIDNFIKADKADELFGNFPTLDELSIHYNGLNEKKSEGSNFETFHPVFTSLQNELKSKDFSKFLTDVTGIRDVFMTDDSLGSGIHQGSDGSFLDVHIDFNIHNKLDVHRRLNLLIYLN